MTVTRDTVLKALDGVAMPGGGTLVSRDAIRAVTVEGDAVRFVIELPQDVEAATQEPLRAAAIAAVERLPGVGRVSAALAAPLPEAPAPAPENAARPAPAPVAGVARVLAVGSGKGGVGKSTVAANLAVALARAGRRVGLLDADLYGPSLPRMMGETRRPDSPDGKTIVPLQAHGVTLMSIGLIMPEAEPVIWRGAMLMAALQQLIGQVAWGTLDVLIVDLPPGTGDIQLTLCQRTRVTGAIIVSTPQDVALLDARKALGMFATLDTPVIGLIENMSVYVCPVCGHTAHLFGEGGVRAEAVARGLPLLGEVPLDLAVREAGDAGRPVAAGGGPIAEVYARIAARLVADGAA